jgi:hypothetical protein
MTVKAPRVKSAEMSKNGMVVVWISFCVDTGTIKNAGTIAKK